MKFPSRPEKRNYQRIDATLDVDLVIEGQKMSATTSNISCGGLFLPTKKHILKEQTNVEVILNIPDNQTPVKVLGEVSRFQDRSLLKKRSSGVAIKFRGLYDDNMLAIDRFIKNKLH